MRAPEHVETGERTDYLDPRVLSQIATLELRARMIVEGMMTGMHRSPYFGFSVEFAQHRPYVPGDDLRHVDWKVFARTDKLYLKQYQKETHLDLIVLLDSSGSMQFASDRKTNWSKYDHAASIAASLAYLALKQQDRVGLLLFAEEVTVSRSPSNASGHWRSIVEALAQAGHDSSTNAGQPGDQLASKEPMAGIASVFDQVIAKLTRRSLLVLISDLLDDPEALKRALARLRYRRHDAIVLQVLDHAELTFPYRAPADFFGLEGEGRLPLNPAALREAYLGAIRSHVDQVGRITRQFGFDHLLVDTSATLGAPLSHFLAERAASISKARHVRR